MEKTNYSVARVVTYTKQSIGKAERHNERKNKVYSNMNVDLEQTKNNVYYKTCNTTYNERLKELIDENKVSLRGLKDNAKIFDELILDINSDYFEKHGGYDFAKRFYEEAFHFAEKEYGKDNIISVVMHADEQNIALTEEYGKPIYHYHLHVIAIPVVKKEIKYSKRTKDKSLVLKEIVLEQVQQVVSYIHNFEWLFIKEKQNASIEEQKVQVARDKKQLTQYQQRLKEIDNLIQHIYEDNVSGKITDEMFSNFSTNYTNEQKDLKEKIEILSKDVSKTEQKEIAITSFVDKVKKYTEIKELTPEIINELIDKILIHQQTKVDGKKY